MIGQRYATANKALAPERGRRARGVFVSRPAFPSPKRLARSLTQSPITQLGLAMACIAVAGILYLAQASQASVLEYNIAVLQSQQVQLDSQNASLRASATQLQSLQRVDVTATQQLHMTKPDLATAIWVSPVLPRVATVRPVDADTLAAEQAAQPLAWMKHVLNLVKSSL